MNTTTNTVWIVHEVSAHHKGSDLDLLIFSFLVHVLQQSYSIADEEGGFAGFGGRVNEGLHCYQLVHFTLGSTQGHHHLHNTLTTRKDIAHIERPLKNAWQSIDGMDVFVHVVGVKLAPVNGNQRH